MCEQSLLIPLRDLVDYPREKVDSEQFVACLEAGIALIIEPGHRRGLPSRDAVVKKCQEVGAAGVTRGKFDVLWPEVAIYHEHLATYARARGEVERVVALSLKILDKKVLSLRAGEVTLGSVITLTAGRNLRLRLRFAELAEKLEGVAWPSSRNAIDVQGGVAEHTGAHSQLQGALPHFLREGGTWPSGDAQPDGVHP